VATSRCGDAALFSAIKTYQTFAVRGQIDKTGNEIMDDLWKIRKRKRMTVGELSGRTGIPSRVLRQYEMGEISIRLDDLDKLARALYVDPWEIKLQSDPPPPPVATDSATPAPRPAPRPPADYPSGRPAERSDRPGGYPSSREGGTEPPHAPVGDRRPAGRRERPPRERKVPPTPGPIRPSQVSHLLSLGKRLGLEQAELEAEAGTPLNEMNRRQASQFLGVLQKRIVDEHPPKPKGKRQRAYLPESVDEFEYQYLARLQEAGALLRFRLFDGSEVAGRVIGFSPYAITIREPDETEVTLQKLAIATYRTVKGEPG
jgi:transcriptional regulator with XRE-family HTH domain